MNAENLPSSYGIDECEILWRAPHSLFIWWELTDGGMATARQGLGASGPSARRVMRLFVKHPMTGDRSYTDLDVNWNEGNVVVPIAAAFSTVRVGIGLLSEEGYFAPIAHSSVVHMPPDRPAEELATRWATIDLGETAQGRAALALRAATAVSPTVLSLPPAATTTIAPAPSSMTPYTEARHGNG